MGVRGGGNPQRCHRRCWTFFSSVDGASTAVLRLLPGKKGSLLLLLRLSVLVWWSGSRRLPALAQAQAWPSRLSPPACSYRGLFFCCRPTLALTLEGVRSRLRRRRRVVAHGRGRALGFVRVAGTCSIVADTTTIAVAIIGRRRPSHVSPPVDEKLVRRPFPCTAASDHALLRLHPDRLAVLGNIVAAGADTLVGGAGGLVHHQPVCLGPKAQAVVLRLRLTPLWFWKSVGVGVGGKRRAPRASVGRVVSIGVV